MQITLLNNEIQAEIPVTSLTSADMRYVAMPICQSSLPAFHSHTNDPILPFFQLYISSFFFQLYFPTPHSLLSQSCSCSSAAMH